MTTPFTRTLLLATWLAAPALAQSPLDDGRALFDRRQYAAARARFEAAARTDARDAWARYWWGRALFAEDKPGPAAERFEEAIAIDGTRAEFHVWAGNSYGVEAQRANVLRQPMLARRVKAAYERAVALDPKQVDARFGLVQFYMLAPGVMGGSMAKAREQATALLAIQPVQGRIALARLAAKDKDWAAAERELQTLHRENPDTARAVSALANYYADRSRPDEAFRLYDQWVARRPRDRFGHYGIGRTAAITGQQLDRGLAALQQALALPADEDDPATISAATIHQRIGLIHEKAGRKPEAKAAYAEALRLAPGNTDARAGLKRVS